MALVSSVIPQQWLEQQLQFDIYGFRGCLPVPRTNLLVSPVKTIDDTHVEIQMHTARGMSINKLKQDSLVMDEFSVLGSAVLIWDCKQSFPQQPFWILNAVDDIFQTDTVGSDFKVDNESCILPFPEQQTDEVRILEFFAGGYGGWHFAATHLQHCTSVSTKVVGIENDLQACRSYAITHGVPIFSTQTSLPKNLLQVCDNCVLHADVFSSKWLPLVTFWRPHIACVSAPCQPWSDAGASKGLLSFDGLAFTEVLGLCRFFKPQFILVEQVEGFLRHPHKQWIFKTCLASGYVPVWSKVYDIHRICPTHRPRWIAIFRHADCNARPTSVKLPTFESCPSPEQFDAVFPLDLAFDQRVFPTPEALTILSDPAFLPDSKKSLARKTSQAADILAIRCGTPAMTTPTFMASYGHQHTLATKHLRTKGCLTFLLQPSVGPPRHWHPIEIFLLHVGCNRFFVDPDWELAYHFLGNQISVVHAMIPLVHAFNMLPSFDFSLNLDLVLEKLLQRRITVSNMIQLPLADGIMVMHKDIDFPCDEDTQHKVREFVNHGIKPFPDDVFWTLEGFRPLETLFHVKPIEQLVEPEPASPEEVEMSPTMKFVPVVPLTVKCLDGDHQYWTFADVPPSALAGLWEGAFVFVQNECGDFQMHPAKIFLPPESHVVLVSLTDGRITFSSPINGMIPLNKLGFGREVVFDQFGIVTDKSRPFGAVFLSSMPLSPGQAQVKLDSLIQAAQMCNISTGYNSAHDRIFLDFQGDPHACSFLKELFVQSLSSQSLKVLGRVCHSQQTMLWFEPGNSSDAAPPSVFRIAAVVGITRLLLDAQRVENGRHVIFKWMNRILWEGPLLQTVDLESIRSVLCLAFTWIQFQERISFVHHGKTIWNYRIADLDDKGANGCKIHVVRSFHGGGAKSQQRVQIKNSLAGTLLEEGVELQWITQHVEKVVDTLGINKLSPIASLPAGQARAKQIRDLFSDAGFPIPPLPKKAVQAPKALQAKARKQFPASPAPSDVVLDCTYLLNEDDSHPKQIHEFRGNRSGVFLTTLSEASPWLKEGQPLSADELGMIIMGDSQVVTSLPQKSILLPCTDCQGNPFLLSATLVQFGSKFLKIKPLDDQKISGGECKVTAVTLWQQDWSSEEWRAAISQTVQFVKEAFSFDLPDVIVSCWGRSLRKGRLVATNADATSIQIHCSVQADQFNSFLSKSGFNRIWTTPKKQDGRISDEYRILWINGDLQHVTAVAAGLSGCAGMVRGKTSLGLRFSLATFPAAWKHVNPSTEVPDHIPATHVFKLEPLPFGCSPQQIEDWAKHVGWKCRPLKATGPCAWLVCAADMPPQTTLAFNGSPLLLRLLPPRNSPSVRTIVAGPRQLAKAAPENPPISTPAVFDPWAQWKGARPSPAPSVVTKATSGPTDQKLQQQDDRIAALEGQIQNLNVGQTKQQQQIENLGQEVKQSEQRLATQMQQAVDDAKNDITKSLQTTLHQQQVSFEQSMRDIRQLLTSAAKRKKSESADDDME